jgi:hypothetical protein
VPTPETQALTDREGDELFGVIGRAREVVTVR